MKSHDFQKCQARTIKKNRKRIWYYHEVRSIDNDGNYNSGDGDDYNYGDIDNNDDDYNNHGSSGC